MMNTSQALDRFSPAINNIAQAEAVDFVRNDHMIRSIDSARSAGTNDAALSAPRVENWPFTVKIVSTPEQLAKAVKLRHDAYAKHVPDVAAKLVDPEEADAHDIVLLVESKFDGSVIGTMRIRTNDRSPLQVEQVVDIPEHMQGCRLAEATRLAIRGGSSRMVRDALFKAFYLVCEQMGVDYMVIGARKPMDRIYEWLDFADVGEEDRFIPLPYAGNIPHRVLCSQVSTIESRWNEMQHPLCDFFWNTNHVDLQISMHSDAHRIEQRLVA